MLALPQIFASLSIIIELC